MKIFSIPAKQAHYIPDRVYPIRSIESATDIYYHPTEIVYDSPAYPFDGSDFEDGATAQNNFRAPKWLYCGECYAKVRESDTESHVCEESDD